MGWFKKKQEKDFSYLNLHLWNKGDIIKFKRDYTEYKGTLVDWSKSTIRVALIRSDWRSGDLLFPKREGIHTTILTQSEILSIWDKKSKLKFREFLSGDRISVELQDNNLIKNSNFIIQKDLIQYNEFVRHWDKKIIDLNLNEIISNPSYEERNLQKEFQSFGKEIQRLHEIQKAYQDDYNKVLGELTNITTIEEMNEYLKKL